MRKPRVIEMSRVEAEADWLTLPLESENLPQALPTAAISPKRMRLGGYFIASLAGLFLLGIGNWLSGLIQSLFASGILWGYLGLGFLSLASLAALGVIWREWRALSRLHQLEDWQELAQTGLELHSRDAAEKLLSELARTYTTRPELSAATARLNSHAGDILDPADRIKLAEREWMTPLDQTARARISQAVKTVGFITAIAPSASFDMLFVAYQNFRLMRDLSHIYGGRPGMLASIRMMRMAFAHVAIAGSLALSDQFLQQFLGKGLAGKLSTRLGEGAVNAILTARLGLAAMDLLRPLPWLSLKKPALLSLLSGLTKSPDKD